tara:strand:+ start:200 stop:427 length:228 start_codon:yes stop_codon:yes gene_type:complete
MPILPDTRYGEAILHAYLDIDYLLREGFDTNVGDCDIVGVKDTIKELEKLLPGVVVADVHAHHYLEKEGENIDAS